MGLDVIELVQELENNLQIRLPNEVVASLWSDRKDIQVQDFITMVAEQVKQQRPLLTEGVDQVVIRLISEHAGLSESEVTLGSWFRYDLDLN